MTKTRPKYKICVSGAADARLCSRNVFKLAREIGREIAKRNGVVVTGATSGVPYWAAYGAKKAGGISIGFSPAASAQAHIKTYHLPTNVFDVIIYTGFDYSGRNLLLTRAADAVITVCGRMGSLNEFTIAFEDRKPQGVLLGSGGLADRARQIVEESGRGHGRIVYKNDPAVLVEEVIKMIDEDNRGKKTARSKKRHKSK